MVEKLQKEETSPECAEGVPVSTRNGTCDEFLLIQPTELLESSNKRNTSLVVEDVNIDDESSSVLEKMEKLNRLNEADARSITQMSMSGSSSSNTGRSSPSARRTTSMDGCIESHEDGSCIETQNIDDDDADQDLWTLWGNLIRCWESEMKRRPNSVKELVRRGIPQHFRTIAWQLLSGAEINKTHELYTDYLRKSSPYEKTILRDIPRTFPELDFFKDNGRGQQSLFNIIKAYSIHDKEVGYCQGSAFIAGQLLLQMPEEEAFAVLLRLMEAYSLRELYKPAMTELGLCMFQLEYIVQEQMPDLHMHFVNMGFDTSMYASSWFLTLFLTTLSLEISNRIMDLFLVDGMDSVFRIAMAILQQSRVDLLKLDMEGMLKYFQRDIREKYENDQDLLFHCASRVNLNTKRMKRLEKEYLQKRTKEQEEAIELRRLRTENRLLRQRIDYLEHESSALADRLIKRQVDLAQQADNCLNISHELNILRDINSDAHRRLEDAYDTIRDLTNGGGKEYIEKDVQVDDTNMIEHIHSLQQDLIEAHTRKADLECMIRDLKMRIAELESANKRLKECPPDGGVAAIQEELIRVKMREAEASLSLKEMRQRLAEIEQQWMKFMQIRGLNSSMLSVEADDSALTVSDDGTDKAETSTSQHSSSASSSHIQGARGKIAKITATIMGAVTTASAGGADVIEESVDGITVKELEERLFGLKIREADTLAELKEMRQKVMELETQNHVCTNQLKRQDGELKRVKEDKERIQQNERELSNLLKESQQKLMEVESEVKEQSVMQRLKYTEALNTVTEMKQRIAQLESKNAEKAARAQIRGSSVFDADTDSLASSTRSVGSLCEVDGNITDLLDTSKNAVAVIEENSDGEADTETDCETKFDKKRTSIKQSQQSNKPNGITAPEATRQRTGAHDTSDSGMALSD